MKEKLVALSAFFMAILLIPLVSIKVKGHGEGNSTALNKQEAKQASATINFGSNKMKIDKRDSFKILDSQTGEVCELSQKDFLYNIVAIEIGPLAPKEAIKAQTLVSYTKYNRLKNLQKEKPNAGLKGTDFSLENGSWLRFSSKQKMQDLWQENFNTYYSNIKDAVDAVFGESITQNGQLIEALCHAISGGQTESLEDVFGGSANYLVSVPSPFDTLATGYKTTKEISEEDFKNIAKEKWSAVLEGDLSSCFGEIERTNAGMVKSIKIGDKKVKGREVREAYGLRSSNFELEYKGQKFVFVVKGYGHGVGMSQNGACHLAKEGYDYKKIIQWYYPNTQINK